MKPKAVPKVSNRQKRKPSPLPKPAPSDWPQPWEPVDLHWAKFALRFGNTAVLARYLREAKEVDPFVLRSVRRLLAAKQGPRLELHRRKRGRPGPRPSLVCLGPAELADLLAPHPLCRAGTLNSLDLTEVLESRTNFGVTTPFTRRLGSPEPGRVRPTSRRECGYAGDQTKSCHNLQRTASQQTTLKVVTRYDDCTAEGG